jgi:hypothetical protein
LIAHLVDQKKPAQGEKGQYGYVRKAEAKPKRSRKKRAKNMEQPPADVDQYAAVESLVGLPTMPVAGLAELMPTDAIRANQPEIPSPHNVTAVFPSTLASTSAPPVRNSPTEEEMDEEESEWAVIIGDSQSPTWGKRKASEEVENGNGNKRARRKYV